MTISPDLQSPAPTGVHPTRIERPPAVQLRSDLPFHRLARLDPLSSRWWRPLAALAAIALLALGGLLIVLVVDLVTEALGWLPGSTPELSNSRNPSDYLMMLGLLGVLTPATVLGVRWGWRRQGTLHSVAGRFRWGLLCRAALIAVPVFLIINWGMTALSPPADLVWPPLDRRLLLIIVFVITLVPLQCAAEEYLFRVLPQQILGTWLRSPLWGILLPLPLFVLGHGYNWVGQVDVACFGLAMGFLVWKTGGVELSILVHTCNNLTLFLLAPLSATSLLQGDVDPRLLLVTLPTLAAMTAGITWWVSRRYRVGFTEPVLRRHVGADASSAAV